MPDTRTPDAPPVPHPSAPRPPAAARHADADVLVVGAGPAGLMLAGELGSAGVRTVLIEREPAPPGFCRGFNLNARSLELLDRRGLADRFLAEGPTVPTTAFVGASRLDLSAMRTDHPYALGIAQTRVEELLAERAARCDVPVRRGHRLTGLREDGTGVTAEVEAPDGPLLVRCRWLAGCDGGRSTVRALAGIPFPGTPARRFTLLGDVVLADPRDLAFGVTTGPGGTVFAIPRPGYVRLITADPRPPADPHEPVAPDRFQQALDQVLGRRVDIAEFRWLTRFGDAARLAERLRRGRVLLAGDAAHVHPPAGAIGVNAAIDDTMNLGWKLSLVARGQAPDTLLDTYHTERHAAGATLLRNTRAQAVLASADEQLAPVRELLAELAHSDRTAGHLAETITGVGTRYPTPHASGHPWAGRLVPNIPLRHGDLLTLLARPGAGGVLLLADASPTSPLRTAVVPWSDRVTPAPAQPGALPDAFAVLVRPDGHAAWIGTAPDSPETAVVGLEAAVHNWFGFPAS